MAGSKENISQEVPALFTRGASASHLNRKQLGSRVFCGTLHLCHLGTKDGAIVNPDQECPSVHDLVRQVGVLWAKHKGITRVTVPGLCTDLCFQGRDCQPLLPEESFSSSMLDRVLGLPLLMLVVLLKGGFFFFFPSYPRASRADRGQETQCLLWSQSPYGAQTVLPVMSLRWVQDGKA